MAYNWTQQMNASANAKVKKPKEESLYEQQRAALAAQDDMSTWKRVGQGVFGTGGETAESLMTSILGAGDRDATYERVKSYNPSNPGVAAAVQSFVQGVDEERAAAAQMQAAMSGYGRGGGQTQTAKPDTQSSDAQIESRYAGDIRKAYDALYAAQGGQGEDPMGAAEAAQREITRLQNEMAAEKERAAAQLMAEYMSAQQAKNSKAMSRKAEQIGLLDLEEWDENKPAEKAIRDENERNILSGKIASDQEQMLSLQRAAEDPIAQLQEALAYAQGTGDTAGAEAAQRELTRLTNPTQPVTLDDLYEQRDQWQAQLNETAAQLSGTGRATSPEKMAQLNALGQQYDRLTENLDKIDARIEAKETAMQTGAAQLALEAEIQTYHEWSNVTEEELTAEVRVLDDLIAFAQARQNEYGSSTDVLSGRTDKRNTPWLKWVDEEARLQELRDEAQNRLNEKIRYESTLSDEDRAMLSEVEAKRKAYEQAQEAETSARETLEEGAKAYQQAKNETVKTRRGADAYAWASKKAEAAVANYNRALAEGADEEEIAALYTQAAELMDRLNAAYEGLYQPYAEAVKAQNAAAQALSGDIAAYNMVGQKLEDRVGAYYQAYNNYLDNKSGMSEAYHQAYENMLGLTALIDGYQAKLDELYLEQNELFMSGNGDSPRAQEVQRLIEEYDAKVVSWMSERANNYAYAYAYDKSRTLAELPEEDRALFDEIAESGYVGITMSEDAQKAQAQLLEKYGEKEYARIAEMVQREYNAQKSEERQKGIEKVLRRFGGSGDVLYSAASVISNIVSAPGTLYEIVKQGLENSGTYRSIDTNALGFAAQNFTREVRSQVGERLATSDAAQWVNQLAGSEIGSDAAKMLYSTLMSGLDSAAAMITGNAIGAGLSGLSATAWTEEMIHAVGGYLLGVTAASNSMQDIAERGGDFTQIMAGGIMSGIFECFFEKFSISQFYKLQEAAPEDIKAVKDVLYNIGKSMITNASEEGLTEIANIAYDFLLGGGASEWQARYEEIKQDKTLTDLQAGMILASEMGMQVGESALSGAIMGAGFGAVGSVPSYIRNSKTEAYRTAIQNVVNDINAQRYIEISDRNENLLPQYRVDLEYKPGVTTGEDIQHMAQEVQDAWAKQNAEQKRAETEHPQEMAEAKAAARELTDVKVRTVADMTEVQAQAVAGTEAGTADAQSAQERRAEAEQAQEGARIDENAVSSETAEDTARRESAQRDAARQATAGDTDEEAYYREEAGNRIDDLAERYTDPQDLAYAVDAEAERLEREENYPQLARAMRQELAARQAAESTAQGTAIDQETAARVDGILNRLITADKSDAEIAQDVGEEVNRLRLDGENDVAAALEQEFERAIREQEGLDNGRVHSDEIGDRNAGARTAGQTGEVQSRAGAQGGTAENRTGRRQGGRSQAERAADRVNEANAKNAPSVKMTAISRYGDADAEVLDVTDTTEDPELLALKKKAEEAGIKLRLVVGTMWIDDTPADGYYNDATQEITVSVDSLEYTVRQLYDHEAFHQMCDEMPGLQTAVYDAIAAELEKRGRNIFDVLAVYYDEYAEIYDDADISEDELQDKIKQEICADCYAGINRSQQGQGDLSRAARAAVAERTGESYREARPEATQTQQETRKGGQDKLSISSLASAAGLRAEMEDGRYVLYDQTGRKVSRVTTGMINKSGIGALINYAATDVPGRKAVISQADAAKQKKGAADLLNMVIRAQDGELVWRFAGSALFSAVKSNSDAQYGTTIDFSTVCRKTQEMMTAMSKTMVRLGRGLTKAEVIRLQEDIITENGLVPCPVCYVFSRWAGVGGILDNMNRWQEKYGHDWDDAEKIQSRIAELRAATKTKASLRALLMDPENGDAGYQDMKAEQEQLQQDKKNKTKLEKALRKAGNTEGADELAKELKLINARLDVLKRDIADVEKSGAPEAAWLERVRSKEDYWTKGLVPTEVLFNLDDAANFAEHYPLAWGYRTSRGPSAGKAILPYSDMRFGDMIMGIGKTTADGKNIFDGSSGEFTEDQVKAINAAIKRTLAQNLIGGQRFQSTSDFRYDYALDYMQVFWEAQALGSKMQTYTKIVEFAELAAAVGGDVNLSVMPLNRGYDENGRLIFSGVTGMNIEAASKANAMYDNVQLILVGINDEHIRLALRDSEETGGNLIGFVIPYHASGASINTFIRGLVENLGESFNEDYYQDYSKVQNDVIRSKGERESNLRDIRKRILTGGKLTEDEIRYIRGKNADISGKTFEELRETERKALAGNKAALAEYRSWSAGVLWDIYQKMRVDESAQDTYGVRLSSSQAEHIMPHEYWNKTVDRSHAYVNGFIFRSYCNTLGLAPRFTGINSDGKRVSFGDFSDETGYWKTLIDRPMYANDGTYRDQQRINVTNVSNEMLTPEYGEVNWDGYKVAEPSDQIAEAAAKRFIERETRENKRLSRANRTDREYMDAVESGDMETVRRMVTEAADRAGFTDAIPEQTTTYAVRTGAAPKKTVKVYKVFTVAEDGNPTALFVSGTEKLPQNVWLNAQDTWHFTAPNGLQYVPSTQNPYTEGGKTGGQVEIPNDEVRRELIERGFLPEGSKSKYVTALAYRPGWHAGDLPFFPQGGMQIEGSNYKNAHRYNQVVFECEMDADADYTDFHINKDGKTVFHDMETMPSGGYYKFSTNPMANSQDIGSWYISGSLKIGRALTEEECNKILEDNGRPVQEWQQFQDKSARKGMSKDERYEYEHTIGPMDLSSLGYSGEKFDAARKTLAPITYDDDGNVIPLSERFNTEKEDIRFSKASRDSEAAPDSETVTGELTKQIEAGDPAGENAKEPTLEQKITAAAASLDLDDWAQKAYDDAMARGNKKTADLIRKQRAAAKMAKDLRREANREKAAYQKDGNGEHLEKMAELRKQANEYAKKERAYAKQTNVQTSPSPRQTIRMTADSLLKMWQVKPEQRYVYREQLQNVLENIWRKGYVGDNDVGALFRAMFDDAVDTVSAEPVYEKIAEDMRDRHIYVPEDVRAEFGDNWDSFRRALFGARMIASSNNADTAIDSYYDELAQENPGVFDPDIDDRATQLQMIYDAVRKGKPKEVSLREAYQMQGLDDEKLFESLYATAEGILQQFANTADLESRIARQADETETNLRQQMREEREAHRERLETARAAFAAQQERQRERRERADLLRKVRQDLKMLERRATHHDEAYARALSVQDEDTQRIMNTVLENVSTVANSITGRKLNNLLELQAAYQSMAEKNPNFIPDPKIEQLLARIGQVHLNDFSVEDLQTIVETIQRISHQIKIENDMLDADWMETMSQAGENMREQTQQAKGRKNSKLFSLVEDSLSLSRGLKRLGDWNPNSEMWKLAEAFERGDMDAMAYTEGADMVLMPFLERRNNEVRRKWLYTAAGEDAELSEVEVPRILGWGEGDAPISDSKGPATIKLQMTQMQLVELALAMKNPDNLRHIKYGGLTVPNAQLYKAGQLSDAYDAGTTVKLGPDTIRRIVNENLKPEGKEFAELLDKYYNGWAKTKINAVSQKLEGVDRAINRNYYPIKTDKAYLETTYNIFDGTIAGMGPLKARIHSATAPIILGDADATYKWHRDMMARYVGYAIPMRNFRTLMNWAPGFGMPKNNAVIASVYKHGATRFLNDFAQVVETGELENAQTMNKMVGNYVNQVLSANISSMLKQFAALGLAGSTYGQGSILRGLANLKAQANTDPEIIRIYTPYLDMRNQEILYDQVTDIVREKAGSAGKIALQTALGRNWMNAMDYAANRLMWAAAEDVVHRQNPNLQPGTEAEIRAGKDLYYKEVARVFNRITFDTQTNSNMMSKPNILRRKDSSIRAWTMFRTDAFQMAGIFREARGQMLWAQEHGTDTEKTAARRKLTNAIVGIGASSFTSAAMGIIANMLRRRDKDLKDEEGNYEWKKIGLQFGMDSLENVASCLLAGSEIFSFIAAQVVENANWYDITSAPLDAVNDLLNTIQTQGKKIFGAIPQLVANDSEYRRNNADDLLAPVWKLGKALAGFFGIPVANLEKNMLAVIGWIWPETAVAISDAWTEYAKKDLSGKQGRELRATLKAYLSDEIGEVSEAVVDEYLRLYEELGAAALPGANAPSTIKETDEDGNETEHSLTLQDVGTWDSTYREAMIDLINEMVASEDYQSMTDDEKQKMLAKAATYASEAGRAAIGGDTSDWVAKAMAAADAGADLYDAISYYTQASWITADKDEDGKTISGSAESKRMDLLASMDLTDAERGILLREFHTDSEEWTAIENTLDNAELWTVGQIMGENPSTGDRLQAIADADLDAEDKTNVFKALLAEGGDNALAEAQARGVSIERFADVYALGGTQKVNSYTKMLDKGTDADLAYKILDLRSGLEPEEDANSVTNMQIFREIAGSDDFKADEKWDAIAAISGSETISEKLQAVRDAGASITDYLDVREANQVDNFLDATRLGMSTGAAKAAVMAVKDLPELPEGESYGTTDRQKAAVRACDNVDDQILAYAAFGSKSTEESMIRKFTAAKAYDVSPALYLDFKDVLEDYKLSDGKEGVTQAEARAALDSMDLTREQKAILWQMCNSGWKSGKNPYSSSTGGAFYNATH